MIKKLYIFIIAICLLSCVNDKRNEKIKNIDIDVNNSQYVYKNIFKLKDIVYLETKRECLISEISQLILIDNKFVILDKKNGVVYMFDKSGKFISKIGSMGHGPGEYVRPKYVVVNKDKFIKVYDSAQRRINIYNFDGEYVKSVNLNRVLRSFGEFRNGNYWGFVSNIKCGKLDRKVVKFLIFDKDGKELKSINGEEVIDKLHINNSYITNTWTSNVSFTEPYSDYLFLFDGEEVKKHFKINPLKFKLPDNIKKELQKLSPESSAKQINNSNKYTKKYFTKLNRYIETEKYVFGFTFGKTAIFFHDKNLNKTYSFSAEDYELNNISFFLPSLLVEDNMYTVIEPSGYIKGAINHGSISIKDSLRVVLEKLKPSDNPVIIKHEIKGL